jgi:predicted nucleic acid-binding protein
VNIFFDTNILVDVFEARPGSKTSLQSIEWCLPAGRSAWIAWHSVALLAFRLERQGDNPSQIRARMLALTRWFEVVPAGTEEVIRAVKLALDDFEDSLQAAAAEACLADVIVTRNTKDFTGIAISVMTPEDFLLNYAA